MGIFDWFKKPKANIGKMSTWQELGAYKARFIGFGTDLYSSSIVRACIRPIAEHTGKANAVSSDERLARVLNSSPNQYMNGKAFLAKIRTLLELTNTAFIYIMRDESGKPTGFYPLPSTNFEALEYNGEIYLEFSFNGSTGRTLLASWNDLAVLRKDYNDSDLVGDSNAVILDTLEQLSIAKQGVANAVKATANLRGILKNTKPMLKDEDRKKQKDDFVRDYMSLSNEGGIASLDATQEFTPISMSPTVTGWETIKEFREDIQRYFGVSDKIITSSYTEAEMEAFYDARIEPFLVDLSQELTRKCFTEAQRNRGAFIIYESKRLLYSSTKTKLNLVQLVDRGALTPNEWRAVFNFAPIEGGDEPIRRLDTTTVNDSNLIKENDKEDTEENGS